MEVMTVKKVSDNGTYKISLMGVGDSITHAHIDNHKTKKNSVIVPIKFLTQSLKER